MTGLELTNFYYNKDEHYPISDSFIENYQQKDGGYIAFAIQTGHKVDRKTHEPNQKWHLLESYILVKIIQTNGNINFKLGVLKCPELILWMAEAAGIDDKIIKEAASYAGKRIDEIREATPDTSYSAAAVSYMNKKFKEKYNKELLTMVIEKIKETNNLK